LRPVFGSVALPRLPMEAAHGASAQRAGGGVSQATPSRGLVWPWAAPAARVKAAMAAACRIMVRFMEFLLRYR
jgi:hypothetical protein